MCKLRCYITSDRKLFQGFKKDVTESYLPRKRTIRSTLGNVVEEDREETN